MGYILEIESTCDDSGLGATIIIIAIYWLSTKRQKTQKN